MPASLDKDMITTTPKVSIVVPIHNMEDGPFFMWRCINSIVDQTFKDYEIVITRAGRMAENTNAGIRAARGEIVKILYLDDYFAHPEALQQIVDKFTADVKWVATACEHDDGDGYRFSEHQPSLYGLAEENKNSIGSPSVVAFRRDIGMFFDEQMDWLLDLDLYKRIYATYNAPAIITDVNVVIGVGKHQTTHILSDAAKLNEEKYLKQKYV